MTLLLLPAFVLPLSHAIQIGLHPFPIRQVVRDGRMDLFKGERRIAQDNFLWACSLQVITYHGLYTNTGARNADGILSYELEITLQLHILLRCYAGEPSWPSATGWFTRSPGP